MDQNIINLEHEIAMIIGKDNGNTVHFTRYQDYQFQPKGNSAANKLVYTVSAYTVNHISRETFLLKAATANTEEKALLEILAYVKSMKNMNTFTFVWAKKGSIERTTSYFFCENIMDAVKKFFTDKDVSDYIIYETKLNPIA